MKIKPQPFMSPETWNLVEELIGGYNDKTQFVIRAIEANETALMSQGATLGYKEVLADFISFWELLGE